MRGYCFGKKTNRGDTATCNTPSGIKGHVTWKTLWPDNDSIRARERESHAVFGLSPGGFSRAAPSSSEIDLDITVTPPKGETHIFTLALVTSTYRASHFAALRTPSKLFASIYESGSSATWETITIFFGTPSKAARKIFSSIRRGPSFCRSSSRRSSAAAVRAFASAICALAFAISACATPSVALACAVCVSSVAVRNSDCSSRILVVRHCNSKNAMVATAPIAVITPPSKTPFQEIGYQYSAQSRSAGSIGACWEPMLFSWAIALIVGAPVALVKPAYDRGAYSPHAANASWNARSPGAPFSIAMMARRWLA
jgi:hypothetical protein